MDEVKLDMNTILKLLRNERSITFISKWYNGTTDNLQINNDNTFQTNWTSDTRCVVARGLTKKRLNDFFIICSSISIFLLLITISP